LERDLPEVVEMKASGEPILASPRVTIAGNPIDVMLPTQELAKNVSEVLKKSGAFAQVDEMAKRISEALAASSKLPDVKVRVASSQLAALDGAREAQSRLTKQLAGTDVIRDMQARIAKNLALTVHATRAAQTGRKP
jgi:hypothetical protein